MAKLKINKDKTLSLIGNTHIFNNMTTVQMQNIMLTLNYEKQTLFDCLFNMEESKHNVCELGLCGGFMFSYKEEIL